MFSTFCRRQSFLALCFLSVFGTIKKQQNIIIQEFLIPCFLVTGEIMNMYGIISVQMSVIIIIVFLLLLLLLFSFIFLGMQLVLVGPMSFIIAFISSSTDHKHTKKTRACLQIEATGFLKDSNASIIIILFFFSSGSSDWNGRWMTHAESARTDFDRIQSIEIHKMVNFQEIFMILNIQSIKISWKMRQKKKKEEDSD